MIGAETNAELYVDSIANVTYQTKSNSVSYKFSMQISLKDAMHNITIINSLVYISLLPGNKRARVVYALSPVLRVNVNACYCVSKMLEKPSKRYAIG